MNDHSRRNKLPLRRLHTATALEASRFQKRLTSLESFLTIDSPNDTVARMDEEERILRRARRGPITNAEVAAALGVSRATAQRRLAALVAAGRLRLEGKGRGAVYRLVGTTRRWPRAGLAEDLAWAALEPEVKALARFSSDEVVSIAYCATEMLNNAIDHSAATSVEATVEPAGAGVSITVADDGVGVFDRVMKARKVSSRDDAILQLEKGKLTTMPSRHSGEGIFFSSKIATRFRLASADRAWIVDNDAADTAIDVLRRPVRGTRVDMTFLPGRVPSLVEVFARWTDPETLAFARTRTSVKLAAVGTRLLSRSEAKRIVAGLEKFDHVELDFEGVDIVGQGFVDEIFRVFSSAHPRVVLEPVRMNEGVAFMVGRGRARP